jgi:hypothetical protein
MREYLGLGGSSSKRPSLRISHQDLPTAVRPEPEPWSVHLLPRACVQTPTLPCLPGDSLKFAQPPVKVLPTTVVPLASLSLPLLLPLPRSFAIRLIAVPARLPC